MVKRVLMVAFHFPPQKGSSGIQRTLKFSRYLPEFGWEPIVLSAHPRAYPATGNDQMHEAAQVAQVHRAFAIDAARHMSIQGRYLRATALPDRWISWWAGAVPKGLSLIREYKPDVIWSTYPIATAHLIGHSLHKLTGIPWVADFRDPMVNGDYPLDRAVRFAFRQVEKMTFASCSQAVFTTPGARRIYAERFPQVPESRLRVIENGYDEDNFAEAGVPPSASLARPPAQAGKPFVLLHSGVIYPSERDPSAMFAALAMLKAKGAISPANFKLVLRASLHEQYMRELIDRNGVGDIVAMEPPIPYRQALAEMLEADGLLIMQAASCNNQIPAKLYEYLRAQRPILALTDPAGDTATSMRNNGVDTIARLDSSDAIVEALPRFLELARKGEAPVVDLDGALANSRKARTREFAEVLELVSANAVN